VADARRLGEQQALELPQLVWPKARVEALLDEQISRGMALMTPVAMLEGADVHLRRISEWSVLTQQFLKGAFAARKVEGMYRGREVYRVNDLVFEFQGTFFRPEQEQRAHWRDPLRDTTIEEEARFAREGLGRGVALLESIRQRLSHEEAESGAGEKPEPRDTEPFRIFVSYRRDDASGYAGRLTDALRAGVGEESGFAEEQIFRDIETIPPGVDFPTFVSEAVASCDVFLAIIGRQWLAAADTKGRRRLVNRTDFVRVEIEAALEKDVPVVPVLVQGAEMPSAAKLPKSLSDFSHRNAVELSDSRWSFDVGQLVTWLKGEERKKREKAERWQRFV
jgi:hypothetical protein